MNKTTKKTSFFLDSTTNSHFKPWMRISSTSIRTANFYFHFNRVLLGSIFIFFSQPTWADSEVFEKMGILKPKTVKQAPNFTLPDLKGQKLTLKNFRGKVVLLNFWATWCKPCMKEMPSMQRLYQSLKSEGIEIIAISIDRGNQDQVKQYAQNLGITFPILLDKNQETRKRYFILGLPTSYLIDKEGKLRGFISGARNWNNNHTREVFFSLKHPNLKNNISFLEK